MDHGWNHRVVKRTYHAGDIDRTEVEYGIYEVYYDADGSSNGVTRDPVSPHGETIEELRETLEIFVKALDAPILDYDMDFGEEDPSAEEVLHALATDGFGKEKKGAEKSRESREKGDLKC